MKNGYKIENLIKSYFIGEKENKIFNGINLEINSNEITVILGKSGCGKTTLLKILAGLEKNDSGSITYYTNGKEKKNIKTGVVFQESRLFPWFNVKENIEIHGKKENSEKYLKMVGLDSYKFSYPDELSGGMAQRVAIARALNYEGDILLMDEPFSALDYFTRGQLQKELLQIHKQTKIGIIFVTHNLDEAITLGKKIVVINQGNTNEYSITKPYPRDNNDIELIQLKNLILKNLEK